MPKGYCGAWICDICGVHAEFHRCIKYNKKGEPIHEYLCWPCKRKIDEGWSPEEGTRGEEDFLG